MLAPIYTFSPTFFERIWGGSRIASHCGLDAPSDTPIGEAWLLSDHPQCESTILDGPMIGKTLRDLVASHEEEILGGANRLTRGERFPLLLKILDAQLALSVQVHPNDAQAERLGESDGGKTEMWYFIAADDDSYVTCGVNLGATPDGFRTACQEGTVEPLLSKRKVQAGQALHIPAGTVHSIGPGCLIAEIQQNSDVTYRLFDWGRTDASGNPRELHLDRAMDVIDFDAMPQPAQATAVIKPGVRITPLASCAYFDGKHIELSGGYSAEEASAGPTILLPLEDGLFAKIGDGEYALRPYHASLIPAAMGSFSLTGEGTLLQYTLPSA